MRRDGLNGIRVLRQVTCRFKKILRPDRKHRLLSTLSFRLFFSSTSSKDSKTVHGPDSRKQKDNSHPIRYFFLLFFRHHLFLRKNPWKAVTHVHPIREDAGEREKEGVRISTVAGLNLRGTWYKGASERRWSLWGDGKGLCLLFSPPFQSPLWTWWPSAGPQSWRWDAWWTESATCPTGRDKRLCSIELACSLIPYSIHSEPQIG